MKGMPCSHVGSWGIWIVSGSFRGRHCVARERWLAGFIAASRGPGLKKPRKTGQQFKSLGLCHFPFCIATDLRIVGALKRLLENKSIHLQPTAPPNGLASSRDSVTFAPLFHSIPTAQHQAWPGVGSSECCWMNGN